MSLHTAVVCEEHLQANPQPSRYLQPSRYHWSLWLGLSNSSLRHLFQLMPHEQSAKVLFRQVVLCQEFKRIQDEIYPANTYWMPIGEKLLGAGWRAEVGRNEDAQVTTPNFSGACSNWHYSEKDIFISISMSIIYFFLYAHITGCKVFPITLEGRDTFSVPRYKKKTNKSKSVAKLHASSALHKSSGLGSSRVVFFLT